MYIHTNTRNGRKLQVNQKKWTAHQSVAYRAPCFEAEETMNPDFYWRARFGAFTFSVGLTANIGLE